jgi:hypothetical protein
MVVIKLIMMLGLAQKVVMLGSENVDNGSSGGNNIAGCDDFDSAMMLMVAMMLMTVMILMVTMIIMLMVGLRIVGSKCMIAILMMLMLLAGDKHADDAEGDMAMKILRMMLMAINTTRLLISTHEADNGMTPS